MTGARTSSSGRVVDPRGYVLVKQREHPRADVRGYVYEHLLVIERHLGRPLAPGERVRHRDGDAGNNDPINLRVVAPLDREATTSCACGCGTSLLVLDCSGRARRYVTGHNSRRGVRPGHRPRAESGAGLPEQVKERLLEDFRGLCAYGCGRPWSCWDHVIPWSDGGSFRHPGNAVPACRSCNQRKGGLHTTAWLWAWVEKGIASDQGEAWESLVCIALDSGALSVPEFASTVPA